MTENSSYTFMTVLTNSRYLPGVIALNYSLMQTGTKYPFKVLIPTSADQSLKNGLEKHNISYTCMESPVEQLQISPSNPIWYWTETLFKLNLFRLEEYKKIVFLDADMIILHSIDELFEKPHMSGVIAGKCLHPEWNGLNSGMMVIEPSRKEYDEMLGCSEEVIKECLSKNNGFGDQDIINAYYHNWKTTDSLHLPEVYNAMYGLGIDSYLKTIATDNGGIDSIKIAHFMGVYKPWNYPFIKKWHYLLKLYCKKDDVELKLWKTYRKFLKESKAI